LSTSITFPQPDGATYIIPAVDDDNWGQNVTNFLIAIPNGVPPRDGTFALTGDLSFGGSFGLESKYYKPLTINPASTGLVRLAKTDTVAWRNNANSADLALGIDGSNRLTFNGSVVAPSAVVATGVTNALAYYVSPNNINSVGPFITNRVMVSDSVGLVENSGVTTTTLNFLDATSSIQTQLDTKAADSAVVHNTGTETVAGAKTFTDPITQNDTSNQLVLGVTRTVTITAPTPASTSRVVTLPDLSGDYSVVGTAGTQTISGTKTLSAIPSINNTFIGMGHNRVTNGAMQIDQVNVGAVVTVNNVSGLFYVPDSFRGAGQSTDGVFTLQRIAATPPTGFVDYTHAVVTTADASVTAGQTYYYMTSIEGSDVQDFLLGTANAITFTLSFWVRSSLTGTFGVGFSNSTDNRNYPSTYTINSANTWEQKTITVSGDTTGSWSTGTSAGLRIRWDIGSGSSSEGTANVWTGGPPGKWRTSACNRIIATSGATWDITGVQLEIGSTASSFEFRPISYELNRCQRQYEKTIRQSIAVADSAGTEGSLGCFVTTDGAAGDSAQMWNYKVTKRVSPTITYFNPINTGSNWYNTTTTVNSGASSSQAIGDNGVLCANSQAAPDVVGNPVRIHAVADARLL